MYTLEEIQDVKIESEELLSESEQFLLQIDAGKSFSELRLLLLRNFQYLRGAAEAIENPSLLNIAKKLESSLNSLSKNSTLSQNQVSYFLKGVDCARKTLGDQNSSFEASFPDLPQIPSAPQKASESPQPSPKKSPSPNNQEPATPQTTKKGLIFVVDDEPDIVDILSDMLTLAEYEVKGFNSAKEALAQIHSNRPNLILSDMKMPQMTGLDFLQEVNKIDLDVPMIFVSGYLDKDTLISALANGVFGVVEKPFNDHQILALTEQAIRQYRLRKLLNRSIDFLMFQFSSLDEILQTSKKDDLREMMKNELNSILMLRRDLRYSLAKKKI